MVGPQNQLYPLQNEINDIGNDETTNCPDTARAQTVFLVIA